MAIPSISSASGSGNAIRSGGITGGGGARASINTWGPLLVFNPFVEFFCELWWNYQGVRIKKLRSL
jgi:hypothetical protein